MAEIEWNWEGKEYEVYFNCVTCGAKWMEYSEGIKHQIENSEHLVALRLQPKGDDE